ncbi:MAG: hypothetical protein ACI4TX_01040 [Christensenellales bacterium]
MKKFLNIAIGILAVCILVVAIFFLSSGESGTFDAGKQIINFIVKLAFYVIIFLVVLAFAFRGRYYVNKYEKLIDAREYENAKSTLERYIKIYPFKRQKVYHSLQLAHVNLLLDDVDFVKEFINDCYKYNLKNLYNHIQFYEILILLDDDKFDEAFDKYITFYDKAKDDKSLYDDLNILAYLFCLKYNKKTERNFDIDLPIFSRIEMKLKNFS